MIGGTLEHHFDASDFDNGRHQADIGAAILHHDTMFDMQLEITGNIGAPRAIQMGDIAADPVDGVEQRLSGRVGVGQHLVTTSTAWRGL
jgi:hypothetical protein